MIRHLFCAAMTVAAPAAWAQTPTDQLIDTLRVTDVVWLMAAEGAQTAASLEQGMFSAGPSATWERSVAQIYDAKTMTDQVVAQMTVEFAHKPVEDIVGFFTTDLGRRLIDAEISVRADMLDPDTKTRLIREAATAMAENQPRAELLEGVVEATDLIERNVEGALNSSFAFYSGLNQAEALGTGHSEEDLLRLVWATEPEIRSTTGEWVYSYLYATFSTFTDAEIRSYIAFSKTEAGQDFVAANFASYNGVFDQLSLALGLAAGRELQGQGL